MKHYASKELIDRAAGYMEWKQKGQFDPYTPSPEYWESIIQDLAKATPEPEPRASSEEYEAKAKRWMGHIISAQYDPARFGLAVQQGYDMMLGPAAEPRASSALLEAARNLVDDIERGSWDAVDPSPVRAAIEAEEAQGPSEVEKLRRELASVTSERDELDAKYLGFEKTLSAIQDCQPTPARFREDDQLEPPWEVVERIWCNLNAAEVRAEKAEAEIGSLCKRLSEAGITDAEALRKDLAEVRGRNRRQYDAIRDLNEQIDLLQREAVEAANADAKLRAFADWIRKAGDCTEEEALAKIDAMLAKATSKATGVDSDNLASVDTDDAPLVVWDKYQRGFVDHKPAYVQAINELIRRVLGGK